MNRLSHGTPVNLWVLTMVTLIFGVAIGAAWRGHPGDESERADREAILSALQTHGQRLQELTSRVPVLQRAPSLSASTSLPMDDSLRQEIARILREELRALSLEDKSKEPRRDEQPPSQESLRALQQATDLVTAATAARQWTDSDAAQFRQLREAIQSDRDMELILQINRAINSGQLMVLTSGPPY